MILYFSEEALAVPRQGMREVGKAAFLRHVREGSLASAYLCQNDLVAFGVIDAMRESGLELGDLTDGTAASVGSWSITLGGDNVGGL